MWISFVNTVGSVVERMKQREVKDRDFQKILQKIKVKLAKSQERTPFRPLFQTGIA